MDTNVNNSSLTCESRGGQEPRGGRGRGRGRGPKSSGRGYRTPHSDLQVYERYTIRQGGDIQWNKWENSAKAALRSQYGAQVESISRVLQEELHPMTEPEVRARNLNTPEKITTLLLTVRAVLDAALPETILKAVHPAGQIASSPRC